MELDKKEKLIKVITSCESLTQLKSAEKYLKLWENMYHSDDKISKILFSKKSKLYNGWNNKN